MRNLDPDYLDKSYDKGINILFHIFGTVGILYNKQAYPDASFNHWSDLYQERYRNDVLLVDGAREIIGLSLNKLGYSLNDTNSQHLRQAEQDLKS